MNNHIANADITAFQNSQSNDNIMLSQVHIPNMGRQREANSVFANNDASKRFSIQYDNDGNILIMGTSKNNTRNCHASSNISTKHDSKVGYNITIGINIHADNHCFVNNFLFVSRTEQLCSVTEFLKSSQLK